MLIEITDIPNNQALKSLDIHIDFVNSANNFEKWNTVESLNKPSVQTTQRQIITDSDSTVQVEEVNEEQLKNIEIPKEMLDESF